MLLLLVVSCTAGGVNETHLTDANKPENDAGACGVRRLGCGCRVHSRAKLVLWRLIVARFPRERLQEESPTPFLQSPSTVSASHQGLAFAPT